MKRKVTMFLVALACVMMVNSAHAKEYKVKEIIFQVEIEGRLLTLNKAEFAVDKGWSFKYQRARKGKSLITLVEYGLKFQASIRPEKVSEEEIAKFNKLSLKVGCPFSAYIKDNKLIIMASKKLVFLELK
ncbi:MAG: hypothetical protein ABIE43_01855 [Patescibacteria group bacterium]